MCMDGELPFESGSIFVSCFCQVFPSSELRKMDISAGGCLASTNAMMSPEFSSTVSPPVWKPGLQIEIASPHVFPPSSLRFARTEEVPQVAIKVPFIETTMFGNLSFLKSGLRSNSFLPTNGASFPSVGRLTDESVASCISGKAESLC